MTSFEVPRSTKALLHLSKPPPKVPKVPKLPTLKLDAVDINADDIDAPEESKSPRIKHSARSLGGKLKDAMSKGLTPRRSRLLAVLTPRSRNNLDSVVRASASESSKAPALQQGPLNAGAGSQQKASHDAISGMSAAQLEGELRLARTDLMATKKEVQIVRTSHASLERELGTAKGILLRAAATERDLRQALVAAEAAGSSNAQEMRQLREQVEALEDESAEMAAVLKARTEELADTGDQLLLLTEVHAFKETQLQQEMQEVEGALREALRDQEETLGSGRSQAFSLQRQLEAEKEQRLVDISRTTQTHASLLSDATQSIKRLERDLETAKTLSTQLAAQLQEANAAAESGTKLLTQAHAEIQLLSAKNDQLQSDVETVTIDRDALGAQLEKVQGCVAEGGDHAMQYMMATQAQQQKQQQQKQQHGSNPFKNIITGIVLVGVGALAGTQRLQK